MDLGRPRTRDHRNQGWRQARRPSESPELRWPRTVVGHHTEHGRDRTRPALMLSVRLLGRDTMALLVQPGPRRRSRDNPLRGTPREDRRGGGTVPGHHHRSPVPVQRPDQPRRIQDAGPRGEPRRIRSLDRSHLRGAQKGSPGPDKREDRARGTARSRLPGARRPPTTT